MSKYLSNESEILGRKATGLCAKCQRQVSVACISTFLSTVGPYPLFCFSLFDNRQVAKTIKRARNFGLLTHIGDFDVQEVRPFLRREVFHDVIHPEKNNEPTISKTIL
jgi:hypothetical protein